MSSRVFSKYTWILPSLLGVIAFSYVVGLYVVDPQNIGWLGGPHSGDMAQHYLGWQFFRNSAWSFPLGASPDFGLELSSSIVFTDSNPLLAIFFKALSPLLPDVFQYSGMWLLACFVLQAWFGFKLVGLATENTWVRLLGAAIILFSPAFFQRVLMHLSLSGHFLVLAALYLLLHPALERRKTKWGLLLAAAVLVHAYLFAMVAALWMADLGTKFIKRKMTGSQVSIEFVGMVLLVLLISWQAGYFTVGAGTAQGGFGIYRTNVLSLINAGGWSELLSSFPSGPGDYEGFNYLGLGTLMLAIMVIPVVVAGRSEGLAFARRHPALIVVLIALTLFALSNNIGVGGMNFSYPLPDFFLKLAGVFRASGRMFWPVYYCLILALITILVRNYSSRVAICCLAVSLFVQVVDTHEGWKTIRVNNTVESKYAWPTVLTDPFWTKAASKYQRLKGLMPGNHGSNWQILSYYAGEHHMPTDAVYQARVGSKELQKATQAALAMLKTGVYDENTLYIIDQDSLSRAVATVKSDQDMLALIDGLYVLAPGWKKCSDCAMAGREITSTDQLFIAPKHQPILFGANSTGRTNLLSGWSSPEEWGTWSNSNVADLSFQVMGEVSSLKVVARAFVTAGHPNQNVQIFINGVHVKDVNLDNGESNTVDVNIPAVGEADVNKLRELNVKFVLKDAISPYELGVNGDSRKLAIGLSSITIN